LIIYLNLDPFKAMKIFYGVLLIIAFTTLSAGADAQSKVEWWRYNIPEEPAPSQNVIIPKLPSHATFAGEKVPLQYFDVRESLMRELTSIMYAHSSILYITQLTGRYKERIDKILKDEGIHPDFFYLCVAESSLQPLTSLAGAKGYWQFLEHTAKEYGLVVNTEVDERYNVDKATHAACKYFRKAFSRYGNWTLAAASYNVGMGSIDARMKAQDVHSYYDMQLPSETARYVFRAIAFKLILTNHKEYGYGVSKSQMCRPIRCKEVRVSGSIPSWSRFAENHGTNFKMLKMCNEWIRSGKMENKQRHTYTVEVPLPDARTNY
jgi:membrane-bound lytic murein transglycosylase D